MSRRLATGSTQQGKIAEGSSYSCLAIDDPKLVINIAKSVIVPTHKMEFLGFVLDTREMAITLPGSKNECHLSHLLSSETFQIRKLAHVIGTLVVTKLAVIIASLHFRALQHLKITSQVLLGQSAVVYRDSGQLAVVNRPFPGKLLNSNPEAVVMESDASRQGWGAVCQGNRTGGKWTASETELHINVLELKVAMLAMQSFWKNQSNVSVFLKLKPKECVEPVIT